MAKHADEDFGALLEEGRKRGDFRKDIDPQVFMMIYAETLRNVVNPQAFAQLPDDYKKRLSIVQQCRAEDLDAVVLDVVDQHVSIPSFRAAAPGSSQCARTTRRLPAVMVVPRRRFQAFSLSTEVSKSRAILESVSPRLTR